MEEMTCPISGCMIWSPIIKNEKFSRYLSDFRELDLLGEGAFGCAYKCQHEIDQNFYAIKIIPIGGLNNVSFETVIKEVHAMCKLEHSNVVRYYTSWVEPPTFGISGESSSQHHDVPHLYIQMELCERSLENLLNDTGKLDNDTYWKISMDVMQGLVYLHGNGFFHGDLLPCNVFLHHGQAKLGDFGCAQCFDAEGERKDLKGAEKISLEMLRVVEPKLKNQLKRAAKEVFRGLSNENSSITASNILEKMRLALQA